MCIVDIGDGRAIDIAIKHALDPREIPQVRVTCCYMLSLTPHASSVRALLGLLSDDSARVRAEAASSLGWFSGQWGDHDAGSIAAALEPPLSDPDWNVRWEAARSLFQLRGCQALLAVEQVAGDPSMPEDWKEDVRQDLVRYRRKCRRQLRRKASEA